MESSTDNEFAVKEQQKKKISNEESNQENIHRWTMDLSMDKE